MNLPFFDPDRMKLTRLNTYKLVEFDRDSRIETRIGVCYSCSLSVSFTFG